MYHDGTKYVLMETSKLRDEIQHLISKARGGHRVPSKDDYTLNECATIIEFCDALLARKLEHAKRLAEELPTTSRCTKIKELLSN